MEYNETTKGIRMITVIVITMLVTFALVGTFAFAYELGRQDSIEEFYYQEELMTADELQARIDAANEHYLIAMNN